MTKIEYKWWKDSPIIGVLILILVIFFQILTFLKFPFLTSVYRYTFAMLLGWFHPFFSIYFIYLALTKIFNKNNFLKDISFLKIWYFFGAILIIFLVTNIHEFINRHHNLFFKKFGVHHWNTIIKWWDNFTANDNAWYPELTNTGFLGAFLYSFFAMTLSGNGAFILAIALNCIFYILFIIFILFIVFRKHKYNKKEILQSNKSNPLQENNNLTEKSVDDFLQKSTSNDNVQKDSTKLNKIDNLVDNNEQLNEKNIESTQLISIKPENKDIKTKSITNKTKTNIFVGEKKIENQNIMDEEFDEDTFVFEDPFKD